MRKLAPLLNSRGLARTAKRLLQPRLGKKLYGKVEKLLTTVAIRSSLMREGDVQRHTLSQHVESFTEDERKQLNHARAAKGGLTQTGARVSAFNQVFSMFTEGDKTVDDEATLASFPPAWEFINQGMMPSVYYWFPREIHEETGESVGGHYPWGYEEHQQHVWALGWLGRMDYESREVFKELQLAYFLYNQVNESGSWGDFVSNITEGSQEYRFKGLRTRLGEATSLSEETIQGLLHGITIERSGLEKLETGNVLGFIKRPELLLEKIRSDTPVVSGESDGLESMGDVMRMMLILKQVGKNAHYNLPGDVIIQRLLEGQKMLRQWQKNFVKRRIDG